MNNPLATAFALIIIFNIRNAIIANGGSISSASVDTCIRVGRYKHPRRSIRASASVVTSICVGRRGWWG
ncbi:hypothetical protein [Leyella stercorea]|uniref:hypothetical protein n=1 Tax=Leyella stercorea TaxID=363265 RepID=UPI00266CEDEF|nr:hypothetical protein [Leyella stercorea]